MSNVAYYTIYGTYTIFRYAGTSGLVLIALPYIPSILTNIYSRFSYSQDSQDSQKKEKKEKLYDDDTFVIIEELKRTNKILTEMIELQKTEKTENNKNID